MKENRVALEKIFTGLRFLGCQGLGKKEATFSLAMFLQARMEDVRSQSNGLKEKIKCLSPTITNKILNDFMCCFI